MTALTDAATAIVPDRVLILNEAEQRKLAEAMDYLANGDDREAARLRNKLVAGDEYDNEQDELARVTLRKRVLEQAVRRCNRRIEDLNTEVVDQLVDQGQKSVTHAGTGATLRIDSQIWARVVVGGVDDDTPKTVADALKAEAKAKAGDALIKAGLGDYVRSDFNTNSISAHFREQVKAYRTEQEQLPEHERVPRDAASFIPPELAGLIELDDTPTIRVTAPRS